MSKLPTLRAPGFSQMTDNVEFQDLTPAREHIDNSREVNLRDLGFVGRVSDEALEEIRRNESRANLVVRTAATFAFR